MIRTLPIVKISDDEPQSIMLYDSENVFMMVLNAYTNHWYVSDGSTNGDIVSDTWGWRCPRNWFGVS